MVHALTGQEGAKGELAMENGVLVFRPAVAGVGEYVFRFDQIKKVHRAWACPVVELVLRIPDGLPVVAFYFVKPPALEAPPTARFPLKRRIRREAVAQLAAGNSMKRKEVDQWVDLIRGSMRG